MEKKSVLKHFGVSSLSSIKDEEIIDFAKSGKLGELTMWSAIRGWTFSDSHELAECIRKAVSQEKELVVTFLDGEGVSEDRVEISYA